MNATIFVVLSVLCFSNAFGAVEKTITKPESSIECSICKDIAHVAFSVIDKAKEVIEAEVDKKVCGGTPIVSSICKKIVNDKLSKIIDELRGGTSPAEVCTKIGLCAKLTTENTAITKTESSIECSICEKIAHVAFSVIDKAKEVIEAEIDKKVCGSTPIVSSICRKIVNDKLSQIIDELRGGTSPADVCTKIGLCAKLTTENKIIKQPELSKCSICEKVANVVAGAIHQGTDAIKELVDKEVCGKIPFVSSLCKDLVNKYLDKIIEELKNGVSPEQVCAKIGLCDKLSKENAAITKPESSVECSICKDIAHVAFSVIDKAKEVIEAEVDKKVCGNAPIVSSICKKIVNDKLSKIIDELRGGTSPAEVCTKIGLCAKLTTKNAVITKSELSVECSICKDIAHVAFSVIDKAKEVIEAEVDKKVCGGTPIVSSICRKIVNDKLSQIIDELRGGTSPADVCTKIGLCAKLTTENKIIEQPELSKCSICEKVANVVAGAIHQGTDAIKALVDKEVCGKIPFVSSLCKDLVNKYLDKIIEELKNGLSPEQVCAKIGLCAKLSEENAAIEQPDISKCSICEKVVKVVAGALHLGTEAIEALVDKNVCGKIPIVSSLCKKEVNKYLDKVIALLKSGVSPEEVCAKIKLCDKLGNENTNTNLILKPVQPNVDECILCLHIAEKALKMLEAGASKPEIHKALDEMCAKAGGDAAGKCKALVAANLEKMLAALKAGESPHKVCVGAKLCI